MDTIEVSQAEMASRIARFSDQESQSAHYAEAIGIPREAYEIGCRDALPDDGACHPGRPHGTAARHCRGQRVSVIIARCPPGDKPLLHAHHYTVESFYDRKVPYPLGA